MLFGSDWTSLPSASSANVRLRVATWNLLFNGATPAADAVVLAGIDSDLVSLQELTDAKAAGIDADLGVRARFPYRVMSPRGLLGGVGLLSTLPIDRVEILDDPPGIEAIVTTGGGPVTVIAAHAAHGDVDTGSLIDLFASYDPTVRDGELAALHARIEAAMARGERVVLAGDMNTSPSEPGFDDLIVGLLDVHREVGQGPGWTFRPLVLADWGIGFIAIDHVMVSPDLVPLGTGVVCLPLSDHCRLEADIGVPLRGPPTGGAP
jgi:endonuclease/exonuclease/phosphatase family metal-dependent hydrolase